MGRRGRRADPPHPPRPGLKVISPTPVRAASTASAKVLDTTTTEHPRWHNADVAQLVAHHLAKVRVAGSSPVVRSEATPHPKALPQAERPNGGVAERRGSGLQSRIHGFESRLHLDRGDWRRGSALPRHGRGHWFDPSIAHHHLKACARGAGIERSSSHGVCWRRMASMPLMGRREPRRVVIFRGGGAGFR